MNMPKPQCLAACQAKFGPEVRLEQRLWTLPTTGNGIEMCYAWVGDKIVAVGGDWGSLLS